jgi:ariadne-1
MVCAAPWKTCNCPWFNYQHIEDNDRLNDMRVPYSTRRQDDVVEVIELPDEPSPPLARRSSTRTRHRSARDRDLDRADQTLASHLQTQLHINPTPTASETHRADPAVQVYGLGNAMGHHMNDSYTMRPAANTSARTIPRTSAPRASFFSRRVVQQPPATTRPSTAAASAMAGLSRDGTKRGANRVGTWLSHVSVDEEAIHTAARDVEVDDWRCDGTMIGID